MRGIAYGVGVGPGDSQLMTLKAIRLIRENDVIAVPGITSFCAAAAWLGLPLVEWDEPLHVVPAVHKTADPLDQPGTYVLMKSAKAMAEVKDLLRRSGRDVQAVENCSMATEKVYRSVEEIPDDAGYFSLIVAKERR